MEKITYTSLATLGEEFHAAFEREAAKLQNSLGEVHSLYIEGKALKGKEGIFEDRNPSDTRQLLGKFQKGSALDAKKAIAAAKKTYPNWVSFGWQKRVALLRKAAELLNQCQIEIAALLSMEVGKNRFESIAEVSESVDLILY